MPSTTWIVRLTSGFKTTVEAATAEFEDNGAGKDGIPDYWVYRDDYDNVVARYPVKRVVGDPTTIDRPSVDSNDTEETA